MIKISHISKQYKQNNLKDASRKALEDVSFNCQDGAITAIIGPNGAGKTTLIKIIVGLIAQDSGTVSYLSEQSRHSGLGLYSDGFNLYRKLSCLENLRYFSDLHHCKQTSFERQLHKLTDALNISEIMDKFPDQLSQGERMRVCLARTLIHNPKYIILDEPTNGLDISSIIRLRAFLKTLAKNDDDPKCIVYTSHTMSEIQKLADDVVILNQGVMVKNGKLTEILKETKMQHIEDAFLYLTGQHV